MDAMCPKRPRGPAVAPKAPGPFLASRGRRRLSQLEKATKLLKVTAKAREPTSMYAGYCYKCGQWGHRSTTCRVVMGVFDEVWAEEEETIGPATSIHDAQGCLKAPRLLPVDSAAFIHTCPKTEFLDAPLVANQPGDPGAVLGDGRPLHFYVRD